ncbi:MAG: hypothetical protein AMXMBFR64_54890 [Myxococcales bacterium]
MAEPDVIAARTTLVFAFQWDASARTVAEWADLALSRRLPKRRADREPCPVWQGVDIGKRAEQVHELSGSIRAMLGLTQGADAAPGVPESEGPSMRWLELHADARQVLFSKAVLTDGKKAAPAARPLVEGVELVVFPIGVGALLFRLDWQPRGAQRLPATRLRHLVHVARTVVAEDGTPGWRLDGAPAPLPDGSAPPHLDPGAPEHVDALGPELVAALYGSACVDLRTAATWLLMLPGDPEGEGKRRLGRSRYAFHQTAVVLDGAPDPGLATELLFHLRRGYDAEYAPPSDPGRDVVLVPRANRMMGVAREGTASLSWVTDDANAPFETLDWPLRFTRGVYLVLALLVQAERGALSRLEELVAAQVAAVLRLKRPAGGADAAHADNVRAARDALRTLAVDMVQYTLSMTPDDTGAITDYDDFFDALNSVYGVKEMQAAVRDDLREVVSLVEATYHELQEIRQHEEAVAQAERLQMEQRERDADARRREAERAADEARRLEGEARLKRQRQQDLDERERHWKLGELRDRRVQGLVAVAGGLTLPFVLVASVFGMELQTLPQWDIRVVIGLAVAASVTLGLFFWWYLRRPLELPSTPARSTNGVAPDSRLPAGGDGIAPTGGTSSRGGGAGSSDPPSGFTAG